MDYLYRYRDAKGGEFTVDMTMAEETLKTHDGRPCSVVITGGNGGIHFKGIGWPGEEVKGKYTRLGFGPGGTKDIGM